MKKILVFVSLVLLMACSAKEEKKTDVSINTPKIEEPQRIKILETKVKGYVVVSIIEVDGHQYLSNYHGGVYHLESCPCK